MKFSLAVLCSSTAFYVTMLIFAAANLWSWIRHGLFPVCCDQEISVGFPLPFHISGGIVGAADFYVLGLLLDVVTALTLAVLITWIARLIRS
jgi:hypothetical protein